MTTAPVHPTPAVELRFHPTDLDPETLRSALRPLGSPSKAIEAGLMTARLMVISQAKAEVAAMTGEISAARLIGAADLAWQIYAPRLVKSLGPAFAEEYLRAMKAAGAGDIPMATVYALAEQHASRVGTYYHESSRDALADGFHTFVNRRIAERVAADRVLDGYGLTARGMSGYTSRSLDKAATVTPLKLKERVLDYIGTSVRRRSRVFATQESHNISQQAQQIAWMWMQDNGKISPASQKLWITARDERVCKQCGPMHGVKAMLGDRFRLPNGTEVWVPGMHPNCRCQVRLLTHPYLAEVGKAHSPSQTGALSKAEHWNPKEHPRGGDPQNPGRFSAKARSAPRPEPTPVAEREPEDTRALQRFLDQAEHQARLEAVLDPVVEEKAVLEPVRAKLEPVRAKLEPRATLERATLPPPEKARLSQVSQPKAALAAATTERTRLTGTPEQRAQLKSSIAQAVLAYDEKARRAPVAPEPNKRKRRQTIVLPKPMYYITDPWEELDTHGNIDLHDEMEFEPNGDNVAMVAAQRFDENVYETAESLIDNGGNVITQTFGDGRKFEATIEDSDVYSVVEWAAYQNHPDADARAAFQIPVTWKEMNPDDTPLEDGEEYTDSVRISEVAEEWHLEPSHFEVKVLVLREGHKSVRGETWAANTTERNGYDTWIATGRYHAEHSHQAQVGVGPPVQFLELKPTDPVIEWEDDPNVGWHE
jgi:hypothetical protein